MLNRQRLLTCLLIVLSGLCGCATDNEFLLKHSCLFPERSDKIPGLVNPRDRSELIRNKAKMAQAASVEDRNVVVAQLVQEYKRSTDPNIRWEVIKAIAKIPHPDRVDNLKMALSDENVDVRVAACQGLVKNTQKNQGLSKEIEHALRSAVMNDADKDVRVAAIQSLAKAGRKCEPETLVLLEQCLGDKVAAVQFATTETLKICTGKDYGYNVDSWMAHFQHQRGEMVPAPKERTVAEKMPKPEWTMFR